MIECQVNFVVNAIQEMMKRNAKVINVKVSAVDEFMEESKEDLKKTVWGKDSCGSWYANAKGDVTFIWPRSCTSYWKQTRDVDWSKFNFI